MHLYSLYIYFSRRIYICRPKELIRDSLTHIYQRARQFSSFILLAGKIIGKDRFDPKCALIVQNKDDFKIPLTFETVLMHFSFFVLYSFFS